MTAAAIKPWDETWWADTEGNPGEIYAREFRGRVAEFWFGGEGASGSDRALLAAQAPAMARVLLRIIDQLTNPNPSISMLKADAGAAERILHAAGVLKSDAGEAERILRDTGVLS